MIKLPSLKKSGASMNVLKPLLKGIVEASMSVVEVGTQTSDIRKSSLKIHDLVNTTATASEEMASTVQGIAEHADNANKTASRPPEFSWVFQSKLLVLIAVKFGLFSVVVNDQKFQKQSLAIIRQFVTTPVVAIDQCGSTDDQPALISFPFPK